MTKKMVMTLSPATRENMQLALVLVTDAGVQTFTHVTGAEETLITVLSTEGRVRKFLIDNSALLGEPSLHDLADMLEPI